MIEDEEVPNTASWCVNGSYFSAWISAVEAEELIESAASFVERVRNRSSAVPKPLL